MAFFSAGHPVKVFRWWHGLLGLLVIFFALGIWFSSLYWPKALIKIEDKEYKVLVAKTPKQWFRGLSGRASLDPYDGMLFVFPQLEQHKMVMRDMNFSIDIVWLQRGRIVDMAPNLRPDPATTEAGLQVYSARLPSDMVLELPAGFIADRALHVGDQVIIAK